jgi:hypothetical protein
MSSLAKDAYIEYMGRGIGQARGEMAISRTASQAQANSGARPDLRGQPRPCYNIHKPEVLKVGGTYAVCTSIRNARAKLAGAHIRDVPTDQVSRATILGPTRQRFKNCPHAALIVDADGSEWEGSVGPLHAISEWAIWEDELLTRELARWGPKTLYDAACSLFTEIDEDESTSYQKAFTQFKAINQVHAWEKQQELFKAQRARQATGGTRE